jgi:hypothetical protein
VRVKVYKADASEDPITYPQFETYLTVPGQEQQRKSWLSYFAGRRKRP